MHGKLTERRLTVPDFRQLGTTRTILIVRSQIRKKCWTVEFLNKTDRREPFVRRSVARQRRPKTEESGEGGGVERARIRRGWGSPGWPAPLFVRRTSRNLFVRNVRRFSLDAATTEQERRKKRTKQGYTINGSTEQRANRRVTGSRYWFGF